MRKRTAIGILFGVSLIGTLLVTMPLSFALERSGVRNAGLSWQSAQGTILNGSLTGVRIGVQPVGVVNLKLRPSALLTGSVSYEMQWAGGAGTGNGVVGLGAKRIAFEDVTANLQLDQLVGLVAEARRAGGRLTINAESVVLQNGDCLEAAGTVSTDAVTRFAASYGQAAGEFTGSLSCDGPMVLLDMSGDVGQDIATAQLRVGTAEASSLEARVEQAEPDIAAALLFYGFETDGDDVIFRQESQIGPDLN